MRCPCAVVFLKHRATKYTALRRKQRFSELLRIKMISARRKEFGIEKKNNYNPTAKKIFLFKLCASSLSAVI